MSTLGNPIWSNIRMHGTLSFKGIPSFPCDKCLKFSSPLATWKTMAIFVSFPFFPSFLFMYQLGMWVIKVSNVWRTIILSFEIF